jgi:hypothetical protein
MFIYCCCDQTHTDLLLYGGPWVLAALYTWSSLPTHTYHSGSVWISLLIAACRQVEFQDCSEVLLPSSIETSVLSMLPIQSIGIVNKFLNINYSVTFKSLVEQE